MRDYCSRGDFGEYVSEHLITGGDRWIENDCCLSTPTAFLLDNCEQSHGITLRKQLILVYIQYFHSLGFGIFIYLLCSDIQPVQRPGDNRVRVLQSKTYRLCGYVRKITVNTCLEEVTVVAIGEAATSESIWNDRGSWKEAAWKLISSQSGK